MRRARMDSAQVGSDTTLHRVEATLGPEDLRRIVLDALVRADPRLGIIPEREFHVDWDQDHTRGPTAHVSALHEVKVCET